MGKSVENLSLVEKVGQMFIVGISGTSPNEELIELIQKYKIGGVILDNNNIESVEQLQKLINTLKSTNAGNEIPLYITISQENGRENKLPKEIRKLPSIKYVAESSDKNLIYEYSKITSDVLKKLGFNMNLCPVLDLGGSVSGKELGDRCVSSNPTIVGSYGMQMVNAIKDSGIIPVPKYFPGHSTTKTRSDFIIPYTRKSISKLELLDISPFKYLMENGMDAMLVGHINLTKMNLFAPATMSYKIITRLIRNKYGYEGIVISDDLCNLSVDIQYGIKTSTRKAILAGNDIVIISDQSKVKNVLEDIVKQIKNGNIDEKQINQRVQRVIDMKEKYKIEDKEVENFNIDENNKVIEEAISKIVK